MWASSTVVLLLGPEMWACTERLLTDAPEDGTKHKHNIGWVGGGNRANLRKIAGFDEYHEHSSFSHL